jgi:catechol 2,3-dioxygenase-like lactoylglutathione lyase family enzyme
MEILFVAGVAPITPDPAASAALYRDHLGLPLTGDGEYISSEAIPGARHFGVWPLSHAASSCFGAPEWPADVPIPQASIEFEVAGPPAVAAAAAELEAAGYAFLHDAREEPWGQTVARLLSPEGLIVGISHAPWLHDDD